MKIKISALLVLICNSFLICQNLKIVSVNVWSGLDYNGVFKAGEYETDEVRERRFNLLIYEMRKTDPDVILIQEANPVHTYMNRLSDSLNMDEIHQVCNAGVKLCGFGIPSNLTEGIGILAKPELNLEEYKTWKLSGSFGFYGDPLTLHFDQSEFAMAGKIIIHNKPVIIINAHLSASPPYSDSLKVEIKNYDPFIIMKADEWENFETEWRNEYARRLDEISELCYYVADLPANVPVILGGDFNSVPQSNEIDLLKTGTGFKDVFESINKKPPITWDPLNNRNVHYSGLFINADGDTLDNTGILSAVYDKQPRRVDYIFTGGHFKKENIDTAKILDMKSPDGLYASDHYAVYGEVNFKDMNDSIRQEYATVTNPGEFSWDALPILSYDTDVGLGYGGKLFLLNPFNFSESFDLTVFNSTEGEQWYRFVVSLPDFEIRQGKEYPFAVDVYFDYDKYVNANYFGTGNNSKYENQKIYTKEIIETYLALNRGFTKYFVGTVGLKYKSVSNMKCYEPGTFSIDPDALTEGRRNNFAFFSSFRYDTRNSFINPSGGVVVQGDFEIPVSTSWDYSYYSYGAAFQYYTKLFYPTTVLAFRLKYKAVDSGSDYYPQQMLLSIGGTHTLRGYPMERFLDKVSTVANVELRFPIWWRFGAVAGFDAGRVYKSSSELTFAGWAANPVIGLRFYMDTFVVRLDAGFGNETTGFYFNFGHLF